jgi:hypothetical protein
MIFAMTMAAAVSVAAVETAEKTETAAETVVWRLDFSRQPDGPAAAWLAGNGFTVQKGFADPAKVQLQFEGGRLVFNVLSPALGVAVRRQEIGSASKARITWGVDRYPAGASYAAGVNNEALMVYVYFGDQNLSSGSVFIPDSPYFIGLYPSDSDPVGAAYTGRHFKAGGRFVCAANPKPGATVVTEYDLDGNFKRLFGQTAAPPVSGFAFEVDTSYLDQGLSKAYIQSIEFLR